MMFEKIWNANSSHLKNYIATKVPEQEVSDIVQNVSLELFKNIHSKKEILNPKAWLFQVTRNIIADHYKKKSRSGESEIGFTNTTEEDFQNCACDIVETALKYLLEEKYSTPLILSDIYKMPQKEIATLLDVQYESIKTRILRARKKVKSKVLKSLDLEYNKAGQIIGGKLKENNDFPLELIKIIKKMELEG